MRPSSWPPARALLPVALAPLLSLLSLAGAQAPVTLPALERGGTVFIEVRELARALGVVATEGGGVLTWRGGAGLVTLFAGSPDALAQLPGAGAGEDVALSAPVVHDGDAWFVPLDALPLLGVDPPADARRPSALVLPDGRSLPLAYLGAAAPAAAAPATTGRASWEAAEAPLAGVRFFDGDGVSLLLVDLALVPLAAPELTPGVDRALDRARETGGDHVLMLLVTALAELPWEPALTFEQEGRRLEVRHPYRLLLGQGEVGSVAPGAPVVGAVLLPASFSLYRPLRVEWGGAAAEVRFRR